MLASKPLSFKLRGAGLLCACLLAGCGGGTLNVGYIGNPEIRGDGGAGTPQSSDGGRPASDAGSDAGADAGRWVRPGADAGALASDAGTAPADAGNAADAGFDGGPGLGPPGDPATRTAAQVCAAYQYGYAPASPSPFTAGVGSCNPGSFSRGGLDDTLRRLNFYRWLVGLGPTVDDATLDGQAQQCAVISAWNPVGPSAHHPPPSATCYSAEGAGAAGSSNIAWGSGAPERAIDIFMEDFGNAQTMGHRRWLLHPPLAPVGIGFYLGGNNYGSSECIMVFGSQGSGPSPAWYAFPPPGVSPLQYASWTWTVHASAFNAGDAQVSITRASDGMSMPITRNPLYSGYGDSAASWNLSGWSAVAGETYQVSVDAGTVAFQYDVKPINCP